MGSILFRKKVREKCLWWNAGFSKIRAVDVVFLWTECGELRGKDGPWTDGFQGLWILQFCEIYFAEDGRVLFDAGEII